MSNNLIINFLRCFLASAFCKGTDVLKEASERLLKLKPFIKEKK